MKRLLVLVVLALFVAAPAAPAATPIAKLQAQLKTQKAKVAKLQGQLAKIKKDDAAKIATLTTQVSTLQGQVTKGAQGGLAAVLAGSPDDMWASVLALWTAFPKRADTEYCGYDKRNNVTGGTSLNFADYTFSNTTNCS